MPDNSFDLVSKIELPEVSNAIQQAMKEITTRFDLKDSHSTIELKEQDKKIEKKEKNEELESNSNSREKLEFHERKKKNEENCDVFHNGKK